MRVAGIENRRQLRSASTIKLVVPRVRRSTIGDRAFPVTAARLWNSLPSQVTASPSVAAFKRNLKTYLFRRGYDLSANI